MKEIFLQCKSSASLAVTDDKDNYVNKESLPESVKNNYLVRDKSARRAIKHTKTTTSINN